MITPIRGRKLDTPSGKGALVDLFRNDNPDKGTETFFNTAGGRRTINGFRNDNPDKGTETVTILNITKRAIISLEMITPIRGRKLR